MLKFQTLGEAKAVLKILVEDKNVVVNQSNEIHTLDKLLEKVEAKEIAAKQKLLNGGKI